jgi:hypothetical protein
VPKNVEGLMDEWEENQRQKGFDAGSENYAIAEALELLGKGARPARDFLIAALKTQRSMAGIHSRVVHALTALTDDLDVAVQRLVDELTVGKPSIDWRLSEHVIEALGEIGPKAKAAVPELRRLLDEANGKRGLMIDRALRQIEGK